MPIANRPLLAPGFHEITPAQTANIFLDPMPLSLRRPMLVAGLLHLLNDLAATKVKCEVWIDGSFTTDKVEPNDVDLVVVWDRSWQTRLNAEDLERFDHLLDRARAMKRYRCDLQCREHRYGHDGILEGIVRLHARRQDPERHRSNFAMKSVELDRLDKRIELVKNLLKEREAKPQDFATSMTVRSLRYHLQDIEQQRAVLEPK